MTKLRLFWGLGLLKKSLSGLKYYKTCSDCIQGRGKNGSTESLTGQLGYLGDAEERRGGALRVCWSKVHLDLTSCLPRSACSSQPHLPSVVQPQGFQCARPSAQNVLHPTIHTGCSLVPSPLSLFKCPFIRHLSTHATQIITHITLCCLVPASAFLCCSQLGSPPNLSWVFVYRVPPDWRL